MSCVDTALQNLYIVGLATTFTVYSTLISSVTYFTIKNKRNLNICLSAWVLLIFNTLYAINFLFAPFSTTISGLIGTLHNLSLLFSSLAAITRYTSEMEGKAKVLTSSICNGILVLFEILCVGVTLFDVLISNESMKSARHTLTLIIPIGHLIFGVFYTYLRMKQPPSNKDQQGRSLDFIKDSMASLVIIAWMIYFFLGVSSFTNTPFVGTVFLLCQSIALLCENAVPTQEPRTEQNFVDEAQPNTNFFTTTMAEGHSVMIETRASQII
jgi:hypothetical protein